MATGRNAEISTRHCFILSVYDPIYFSTKHYRERLVNYKLASVQWIYSNVSMDSYILYTLHGGP